MSSLSEATSQSHAAYWGKLLSCSPNDFSLNSVRNLTVTEVAAVTPDRNSNSIQFLSTPFRFTVSVLWLLQSKPQARSVPSSFDVPKKRWPRQGESVGRCSYCFIFQRLFSFRFFRYPYEWTMNLFELLQVYILMVETNPAFFESIIPCNNVSLQRFRGQPDYPYSYG